MTTHARRPPTGQGAKVRAAVGAVALLVIGAVVGIAVDRRLHAGGSHSPVAAFHEAAMSGMVEEIELTPEQRRQVEEILRSRHDTMQSLWQAIHHQLGTTLDSVHAEIEVVLTPEQREAFRRWLRANSGDAAVPGNPGGR